MFNEATLLTGEAYWLPVIFIGLMGLAFLMYAILDGYDLGVGILLPRDQERQRDTMIASIGPYWDANETWLVLGVGLLLIAFPKAHNMVLFELYLPVALMLAGLILRGVSFDFRAKVHAQHKNTWDLLFRIGSLTAAAAQGFMLGLYVMSFERSFVAYAFALLSAACVTAGYTFIGASWLLMKTEGALQARAAVWAYRSGWWMSVGIATVSVVNPWVNATIFEKWLGQQSTPVLLLLPSICFGLLVVVERYLRYFQPDRTHYCWLPFVAGVVIFILCFVALAYSFFPYVVPAQLTVWDAASATASLRFILYGVLVVMPAILFYTVYAYRVFWGKATALEYY